MHLSPVPQGRRGLGFLGFVFRALGPRFQRTKERAREKERERGGNKTKRERERGRERERERERYIYIYIYMYNIMKKQITNELADRYYESSRLLHSLLLRPRARLHAPS